MHDTFTTAKTKAGRTKPSTGPHAARGLDIAALVHPPLANCSDALMSVFYSPVLTRSLLFLQLSTVAP